MLIAQCDKCGATAAIPPPHDHSREDMDSYLFGVLGWQQGDDGDVCDGCGEEGEEEVPDEIDDAVSMDDADSLPPWQEDFVGFLFHEQWCEILTGD